MLYVVWLGKRTKNKEQKKYAYYRQGDFYFLILYYTGKILATVSTTLREGGSVMRKYERGHKYYDVIV